MSFRIYTEPDENAFRVYADIDGETMWVGLVIWQVTKRVVGAGVYYSIGAAEEL